MIGRNSKSGQTRGPSGLSRRQLLAAGAGAAGVAAGAGLLRSDTTEAAILREEMAHDAALVAAPISHAYVEIVGQKQGSFKGLKNSKNIEILSYSFDVATPLDPSSGLPSGRRQWKPVTITKAVGPSSPQLLQALVTNENLTLVKLTLERVTPQGKAAPYFTIELENAEIVDLTHFAPDTPERHLQAYPTEELEEISFTFQKIQMTDIDGKTSALDDWSQPG